MVVVVVAGRADSGVNAVVDGSWGEEELAMGRGLCVRGFRASGLQGEAVPREMTRCGYRVRPDLRAPGNCPGSSPVVHVFSLAYGAFDRRCLEKESMGSNLGALLPRASAQCSTANSPHKDTSTGGSYRKRWLPM